MIRAIHHVGIAVEHLEPAIDRYRLLGIEPEVVETLPDHGVRVAFLRVGDSRIEFVEPLTPDSAVGRFLAKRGEGLHHLAFEVEDIAQVLPRLAAKGFDPVDRVPRPGARGHLVAFLQPRGAHGVLLELVQETRRRPPAPDAQPR